MRYRVLVVLRQAAGAVFPRSRDQRREPFQALVLDTGSANGLFTASNGPEMELR